jgi:hypothetical protein
MLDIPTAVKATLAQSAIAAILRYAGYQVCPGGIEERCPSIVHLSADAYRSLALPDVLRFAPDLMVYAHDHNTLQLVECKFTRSWTCTSIRMMASKLTRQAVCYPTTYAVILRSAVPRNPTQLAIDDLVRVLPPEHQLLLATAQVIGDDSLCEVDGHAVADPALEPIWQKLLPLAGAFPLLAAHDNWGDVLLRTLPAVGNSA